MVTGLWLVTMSIPVIPQLFRKDVCRNFLVIEEEPDSSLTMATDRNGEPLTPLIDRVSAGSVPKCDFPMIPPVRIGIAGPPSLLAWPS